MVLAAFAPFTCIFMLYHVGGLDQIMLLSLHDDQQRLIIGTAPEDLEVSKMMLTILLAISSIPAGVLY